MAYADRADLPRHGLNVQLLAQIPTGDQDDALATASEEADDYLRDRFPLPLTAWSRSLRKHICAMAAYELQVVRGYNIDSSDKELRRRYDDAIGWLKNCSLGQLTPEGATGTPTADDDGTANDGGAAVASRSRRRPLR